ncbi:hypothetical protein BCD91_004546 [Clostridium beijerinckii]|uniref:hypothetical protein n=1 Tax=Clostridium beijerinckii TaxID=1520 RepID=UPI00149456D0|nr:hypothetical protein [Clostridium beijerinckii]NOW92523.1 hypothetical protein [Clostridium beijerinckii]
MKKYYDIGQETENIIMQLKNKCQELNLGNINFSYFADGKSLKNDINFYLTEYKGYWELVIKQDLKDIQTPAMYWSVADVYKIYGNELNHEYSEKDLI